MAAVVDQVNEMSLEQSFNRVYEITLSVGVLSGVDISCLDFCFSEATQNTVLNGAKLNIESVDVALSCVNCGEVSRPNVSGLFRCSRCQSDNVSICKGREFNIIELEVESIKCEHSVSPNEFASIS
jgi:hydrogenase nickel incorporation protein HypA/HybF